MVTPTRSWLVVFMCCSAHILVPVSLHHRAAADRAAQKSHMTVHIRKHTGEKTFACTVCSCECLAAAPSVYTWWLHWCVRACIRACVRVCVRMRACVRAHACVCACACVHVAHVLCSVCTRMSTVTTLRLLTSHRHLRRVMLCRPRDDEDAPHQPHADAHWRATVCVPPLRL
jgi:hypothetical protein